MDSTYRKRPLWRQARWIIPAAIIAALALIAAIVLATSGSTGHQTIAAPTSQACPTAEADDTIPTAPPNDLHWKSIGAMLVPTSATYGPARYDGPTWECFAHSPMGAVIAAYNIAGGLISPAWRSVAEHEVFPGQGQQAFIAAGESQTYQLPAPGDIAQAVGFEVVTYTPLQATVETLADAGNGQYQANEFTVAWTDGDWKMVLSPDGKAGPDPQLVTSANGFVLWSGNDG